MRVRAVLAATALEIALVMALVMAMAMVPMRAGSAHTGAAASGGAALSASDVQLIITQAVDAAQRLGAAGTIAVIDTEGNALGVFKMNGGLADVVITAHKPADEGLEGLAVPQGAAAAAISKAGTAAYLSSDGSAFTTRTAGFLTQEHIPPGVRNQPSGPLFGVQFSQLPCSDVTSRALPLGLSADPGGAPIYKNGIMQGGVGVEIDGHYDIGSAANDDDQDLEESVARAATQGYDAPAAIRADQILIDGVRLPYMKLPGSPAGRDLPSWTGT